MQVGARVGAIIDQDDEQVRFLGYGVYEGDKVPDDDAAGPMAETLREYSVTNPCIKLDNGDTVWGCECWWGDESEMKKHLTKLEENGIKIVPVTIGDIRAESDASKN